ncbi:hypothetical protein NDU88_001625 [Pleurodeles waltl]|uniref:Uncharacterized protein n=1 Tax=Pleurodeles waltl TaxID=8319 RepID=A0AAV7P7D3_PLEWA|nr:hypothetical protein NDU88_001625 [Pleurodeles waltl]
MTDDLVQKALQMLQEFGRMDLVHESALEHFLRARKVASHVLVALRACFPPHQARSTRPQKKGVAQASVVWLGDPGGEKKVGLRAAGWMTSLEEAGG